MYYTWKLILILCFTNGKYYYTCKYSKFFMFWPNHTLHEAVTLDLLKNWNNGIYVIGEKRQLRTFPAFLASSTPVVDKSASCQPQKRFFWFHSLSPWRTQTKVYLAILQLAADVCFLTGRIDLTLSSQWPWDARNQTDMRQISGKL